MLNPHLLVLSHVIIVRLLLCTITRHCLILYFRFLFTTGSVIGLLIHGSIKLWCSIGCWLWLELGALGGIGRNLSLEWFSFGQVLLRVYSHCLKSILDWTDVIMRGVLYVQVEVSTHLIMLVMHRSAVHSHLLLNFKFLKTIVVRVPSTLRHLLLTSEELKSLLFLQ